MFISPLVINTVLFRRIIPPSLIQSWTGTTKLKKSVSIIKHLYSLFIWTRLGRTLGARGSSASRAPIIPTSVEDTRKPVGKIWQ